RAAEREDRTARAQSRDGEDAGKRGGGGGGGSRLARACGGSGGGRAPRLRGGSASDPLLVRPGKTHRLFRRWRIDVKNRALGAVGGLRTCAHLHADRRAGCGPAAGLAGRVSASPPARAPRAGSAAPSASAPCPAEACAAP